MCVCVCFCDCTQNWEIDMCVHFISLTVYESHKKAPKFMRMFLSQCISIIALVNGWMEKVVTLKRADHHLSKQWLIVVLRWCCDKSISYFRAYVTASILFVFHKLFHYQTWCLHVFFVYVFFGLFSLFVFMFDWMS